MRRVVHICSQNGVNWRRVGQPSSGVSDGYTWDAAGNPHYSEIDNHAIYYGATDFELVVSNRYDHLDSGAGGVGGLLYLAISNSSTRQLYVPWYDAYGNVMGYWDAQGNVVAEYTYDAFGKLIIEKGSDFSV